MKDWVPKAHCIYSVLSSSGIHQCASTLLSALLKANGKMNTAETRSGLNLGSQGFFSPAFKLTVLLVVRILAIEGASGTQRQRALL